MWTSGLPSRSGYQEHPSQHGEHDVQLTDYGSNHHHVQVVGGGVSSSSGSTVGLKDWEQENKNWPASEGTESNKGIMKTVKITQL